MLARGLYAASIVIITGAVYGCNKPPVSVTESWMRPATPDQREIAVYATIQSQKAGVVDRVQIEPRAAGRAIMARTVTDHSEHNLSIQKLGDRPIPEMSKSIEISAIPLKPGVNRLQPGGYYITLIRQSGNLAPAKRLQIHTPEGWAEAKIVMAN